MTDLKLWNVTPLMGQLDAETAYENVLDSMSSDIVGVAFSLSFAALRGKKRKIPRGHPAPRPIPAFRHALEVGSMLGRFDYDDHVVAAGFLHDILEDAQEWNEARLRAEFEPFGEAGGKMVDIVVTVTVPKANEDWTERRERYRAQLANGPLLARPVACVDKISNMRSSDKLAKAGFAPQNYLDKGWEENYSVWLALGELFKDHVHPLILQDFYRCLAVWKARGIQLAIPGDFYPE